MEVTEINPLNKKMFSLRYWEIEKVRKTLPAFKSKNDFLNLVKNNLVVIVEGDTGSGKTTQLP
jgi:pre-mRNA-splicing factor ATP-dependent RNA helicase DHX15/PRP43